MDSGTLRKHIEAHLRAAEPPDDPVAAALPGVPEDIVREIFPGPLTPAAVLLPLLERGDGLTLLLTQRTRHLKDHPGQISFPGGRIEPHDDGPVAAALRESHEEVGLPRKHVDVLGVLDPHAVITGFAVTPVVGLVNPEFDVRLDAREVEAAFEVPLAFFLDRANRQPLVREYRGLTMPAVEYHFNRRRIWGATAMMIDTFIDILNKSYD